MKNKVKVSPNLKEETMPLPEMFMTEFNLEFTDEVFQAMVVIPPTIPACVMISLAIEEGFIPADGMGMIFEEDSPEIFVSEKAQQLVSKHIKPDCHEHFWLDIRDDLLEEAETDEFDDDERPDLH